MATDQDDDMYLFNGDAGQTPNSFAGQAFDHFLDASTATTEDVPNNEYLNPGDLAIKREYDTSPRAGDAYGRGSTSSSSSSSSSDFPHHNRNVSTATTTSPAINKNGTWDTGINGLSMPMNEQYFDSGSMTGIDQDFDQQMASAFDFDTAASTPSGFDSAALNGVKTFTGNAQMRRAANMINMNHRHPSPRVAAAPASFFLGSREASPLNSMLPAGQAPSPWAKHSPSSGLEETFNHMGMDGDSPGNATFSPNMHMSYSDAQFSFAPDSSGTPSSFAKDISSPPSTIHSVHSVDGQPTLRIYPTSLKSRVETQIPIKMTLYPLPQGIRKLRLPTHTVSKPKFLAKPEFEKSPDTLELHVSLVCTSAMQDPHRKQRALARARGDDLSAYSRPSPASSTGSASSKEDDEKPLNGGEVKICSGCIQRERKRASRKKQKKPEEEELFQKDEEKRVVVFNTNEVKEWTEPTKDGLQPNDQSQLPPPGTMQVELPMRIACYCRHQNEKMGFQVIFTVKDFRDRVIAQAMTNSIMITDDHKTHNAPQPLPAAPPAQMAQPPHFPGAGVFNTGAEMPPTEAAGARLFKQSYSTPDLTRLQHGFNGQFNGPSNTPFAIPQAVSSNTSATLTPRNLSRPASPSGPSGPATKRRKPSGSGKLPSALTMTRLDTIQAQPPGSATMPNTAASSPYAPNMPNFVAGPDNRNLQSAMHHRQYNSPPTPGGDGTFNNAINRSFSLENLPRQALMSAPSSRQPSRPGSPLAGPRNSFGQTDGIFPQAVNQQLMAQSARRPAPVIHKLVPNEGSTSGGTEVTLLGNGFYQGLEVMFGDTEATTTTFWGEKCLNCIAPPAVQPGMVAVVFKHEHPHYAAVQTTSHVRHSIFTYVDDREIEMLRLALRTIGKQMGTDDPYTAAQQLLQQNQPNGNAIFPQQGVYGGMTNGLQMTASAMGNQRVPLLELESSMMNLLCLARRRTESSPVQLDLRRPSGLSMMHFAASLGMPMFINALLAAGADPNVLDNNGFTPMHHAAMHGHEQVINQLRVGGADHRVRSVRNFIPADLATTLQAYQATMRPYQHSRSKSSGASTLAPLGRNESSRSLSSFWEINSVPYAESEPENTDDERGTLISPTSSHRLPFAQPIPHSAHASRRSSRHELLAPQALVQISQPRPEQPASPSTLMSTWRQLIDITQAQQAQLVEQFQYLQDNIPALPQLPQLDSGVMRRMSALFPQRPSSTDNVRDRDEAASSPGSSAPPSYEELYPAPSSSFEPDKKEVASAVQAAAEAALDQHFERQETSKDMVKTASTGPGTEENDIGRVSITQDRRLMFFWIPLLLVLLAFMIPGSPVPKYASAAVERYVTPRMIPVA